MDDAGVPETLELDLLSRVRDVLADQPVTEAELRTLSEQADGWVRALGAQTEAAERRLDALAADPAASLSELARELRRVETLLPALAEARALHARLEAQAKRIRSARLLQQTVGASHTPTRE